jgi:amino acid transporter
MDRSLHKASGNVAGKGLGFWAVVAIGVGGMVGGGIFAVLGLSVRLARGGTPIAFAIAGVIALLTTYSYSRLSVAYPGPGGTVTFLNRAFGSGSITGTLNVLLWLSYVVMISLYAYAFGSYGATFFSEASQPVMRHVLMSLSILVFAGLNVRGAAVVGRAETWVVALKILILLVFLGAGFWGVSRDRLAPAAWSPPLSLIAGGMIIFLAYEGFELIANTSHDVRNPKVTLPRAYFSAIIFVISLYVLIAIVAVGNLPVAKIVSAQDYALAEAARPFMGNSGFTLIAVAALLSTASAINATLYGAARLSYVIAKDGELPAFLERNIWSKPLEGLLITTAATLLLANLCDLSSISMMGSAGFLAIFATVNLAAAKLSRERVWPRAVSLAGALACFVALLILIARVATTSPGQLWLLVLLVGLASGIEFLYRGLTGREIRLPVFRLHGPGRSVGDPSSGPAPTPHRSTPRPNA